MEVTDIFIITKRFHTAEEFEKYVTDVAMRSNITYLDAVLEFCERNSVDISACPNLISKKLKNKMKAEAERLRLIK